MLTRRAFATASRALAAAPAARAQNAGNWPDQPVAAVVPWPAGGPTDAFARLISQRLSTDLGRPFVVDNRGGANGTIGMASAARARPAFDYPQFGRSASSSPSSMSARRERPRQRTMMPGGGSRERPRCPPRRASLRM